MNSPLKKIGIWSLVFATTFFCGCADTQTSRKKAGRETIFRQKAVSPSNIRIDQKAFLGDTTNVDNLIQTSENYIQYLSFRKRYSNYENQITSNLKNNSFDATKDLVRELANKLESDQNPYAQDYLKRVKSFSYIIYEVYEIEQKKEKRREMSDVEYEALGAIGRVFPIALIVLLPMKLPDMIFGVPAGTRTEVIGKKVTKIKVTPYAGQKTILESDIPYSRLAEELKRSQ